ncbi:hypothetical protein ACES2L_02720 [Bdellovibrio bacteriovorus]
MKSLKKGQILKAKVEEVTSPTSALCNFQGELLLIANHTGKPLQVNDPITLQVVSVNPLQFEIFNSRKFERVI